MIETLLSRLGEILVREKKALAKRLFLFGALIVPVLFLAGFSFVEMYRNATRAVISEHKDVAFLASSIVKARLDSAVDLGAFLASDDRVRGSVRSGDWKSAARALEDVPAGYPYIERVMLLDYAGTVRAASPAFSSVEAAHVSRRDWLKAVRRAGKPFVSGMYLRASPPRNTFIDVAVPIPGPSGRRDFLGILLLQVKPDVFPQWIKNAEIGYSGFIYVVDQFGQLVHHPKFDVHRRIVAFSRVPVVWKLLEGLSGACVAYNPVEQETQVSAFKPVKKYQWGVVVTQPARSAFGARNRYLVFVLLIFSAVILSSSVLVVVLVYTDLQRKKAEDQLKVYAEELSRSNRELQQFTYVASHDLQEPLRKISAFSNLLVEKDASALDEESRDFLRRMQNAAGRMRNLIEDLLSYSRVSSRERVLERIPLKEVISEVLSDLEIRIRETQARVDLGELPVVFADKTHMRQLFQNLIGNALKYHRKGVPPELKLSGRVDEEGFDEITVSDNGIGFDEKYKDRIFYPFQRLHSRAEFEGTGIGLAICRKIVNQLGGDINVRSRVGVGTVFIVTLPRV
jgi:signal transduction histidine kinase